SGATFTVDLQSPYDTAGGDYDQVKVTGSVMLDNATLQLVGGDASPTAGQVLVLIDNDDTDSILGAAQFNGLPEGASVSIGKFAGTISYHGGVDHTDVVLIVPGPVELTTWHFDLNAPGTPTAAGYMGVLPTTLYVPTPGLDFGWAAAVGSFDRGLPNDLLRDGHYGQTPGVFRADVDNGTYLVSVTVGDRSYARDQIEVSAEGSVAAILSSAAGQFIQRAFVVQVTDGRLD